MPSTTNDIVQQCIDVCRKEWFALNNTPTDSMDARELALHVGRKVGVNKCINLLSSFRDNASVSSFRDNASVPSTGDVI